MKVPHDFDGTTPSIFFEILDKYKFDPFPKAVDFKAAFIRTLNSKAQLTQ